MITNRQRTDAPDILKGLIAGVAGGLLASLVMEQFQALWSKVAEEIKRAESAADQPKSAQRKGSTKTPATVKAAEAISENIFGKKLPKKRKEFAGEAVHYAMGMASGAIYGALAEVTPLATAGAGLAFGTGVWLSADEAIVPALGLSKSPRQIPVSIHAYALVSHLVYGFVTEVVRRALRQAL